MSYDVTDMARISRNHVPLGPDGTPSIKEERARRKAERAQARVIEEQIRPASEFARMEHEEGRRERLRLRLRFQEQFKST